MNKTPPRPVTAVQRRPSVPVYAAPQRTQFVKKIVYVPLKKAPSSSVKFVPVVNKQTGVPYFIRKPVLNKSMAPGTLKRPLYYGMRKALKPVFTPTASARRIYSGPLVVRRGRPIPRRRMFYPGTRPMQPASPAYASVNTGAAGYSSAIKSPGAKYVPGYGYCTPAKPVVRPTVATIPVARQVIPALPVVRKPCHTCGSRGGCTTLSRFAFNNAQLTAAHKKQIQELALRILRSNINAVVVTGHTDSVGSEKYNAALGARRAGAAMRELRRQLKALKPNAHKDLFWKIRTRGETKIISKTDAAANRRVHICVKKIKL